MATLVDKKIKVDKILGDAFKIAITKALGPGGMAVGIGVDVVKAVTSNNKKAQENAKDSVVEKVTDTLVEQIAKNPALINQMNLENPVYSRTAQGGLTGLLVSAYMLYKFGWLVPIDSWNIDIVYPAFIGFTGSAWVLYGRLVTGLPPAFGWIKSLFAKKSV